MRRLQLIEFHEQAWFPAFLRDYVTDALQFGFNLFRIYGATAPRLQRVIDITGSQSIVDLCSGGGGPWLNLSRKLRGRKPAVDSPGLQIWLTDKYPNPSAMRIVERGSENQINFYPGAVDATRVPRELAGLRTMFTAFHHFSPEEARAILQDAVDAGESIGTFEISRRSPLTVVLTFAFALALIAGTPWIRPFRWSRLLWTYLIPIIPFVLLFDGVVSCLRTYRSQELREIVDQLNAPEYEWEIGEDLMANAAITYLIGYPQERAV
jgi:hypothetical protein